jgi:hypothetical protein
VVFELFQTYSWVTFFAINAFQASMLLTESMIWLSLNFDLFI